MSASTLDEVVATAHRQVRRVRRPEYTGENRCRPCTALNLAITAAIGAALWPVHPALGVVTAAVGVSAIYLRGYLIPGTPTITERYFPEPVLRLFDKADGTARQRGAPVVLTSPELRAADLVVDGEGSRLTESFRRAWRDRIDALDLDPGDGNGGRAVEHAVADTLGLGPEEITAVPGAVAFSVDDRLVQWECPGALLADVAAAELVADRSDGWADLGVDRRLELLAGLRCLFERCPECGGTVRRDLETPKTCCRDPPPVVLCTCEACDARLVERAVDEVDGLTATADG